MTTGPFPAPRAPQPAADERELLLGYLRWQREQLVAATAGLDEEQLRWTPDGRLLPILGVINHVTHVEWRWVNGRYLGEPFPPREEEFLVPAARPAAEVIETYWSRAHETERIVRAAPDLSASCLGREADGPPVHLLLDAERAVDLRYVLLHLIEETAHHAGHADATRELLDGTRLR